MGTARKFQQLFRFPILLIPASGFMIFSYSEKNEAKGKDSAVRDLTLSAHLAVIVS